MYTIKRLMPSQSNLVVAHLNRLDPQSIYDRFCTAANSDFISRYVSQINFIISGIFGVFDDDLKMIGLGECVAYPQKINQAEVAFSVEKEHQGKGLGNRLMKKLIQYSKAQNINELHMYCLKSNSKSLHIARKYGLNLTHDRDEVNAKIALPITPSYIQQTYEVADDIIATFEMVQKNNSKLWKSNKNLIKATFRKKDDIHP